MAPDGSGAGRPVAGPNGVALFSRLVRRDVGLALRAGTDATVAVGFFVIVVVLFPLGLGPEPDRLSRIAAAVIWVAGLLASLLSLERLFLADYEDGSLDLLALAPLPLEAVVLAKISAHWIVTGIPVILVAPVLGVLMGLPAPGYGVLTVSLLLGTPVLSLLGGVGAAITLGARRGGVLLALLILPLFVPVLIFAVAAVDAALLGLTPRPHLLLLAGILALVLPLAPIAAAAGVREALA